MAREQAFQTVVKTSTDGRLYLPLPFDPASLLDRPFRHLSGAINGAYFRGQAAEVDGQIAMPVGLAWVRERGYAVGDQVEVVLRPEGPLREDLAADLADALAAAPKAGAFWDMLAPFYRKGYLRWIEATKRNPGLRAARIAQVVEWLSAGRKSAP